MAQVLVTESYLDDIAEAIRGQNGSNSTYTPAQMAAAVNALYPEPSGAIAITENGIMDVKSKETANVNVPNSYSASDEGKVVSSGELVTQTSQSITANGTYDTTKNNEVVVNVPSGSGNERIVDPVFQGITYMYVNSQGIEIYTSNSKLQYLNIFEVQKNHTYVLFVGKTVSNRRRAGFFRLSMSDLEQYLDRYTASDTLVYSGGVWLAPYVQGQDDTNGLLIGRIIFDAPDDGVVLFGTSNIGATAIAYCIDMT